MQAETMQANRYFQSGGSHPYEHKLRLRPVAPSPYCRNSVMERSLTVTNFQIAPRTTFEMERPITQGSPRLVVINTSFRSSFNDRRSPRKRVPTFPELATDAAIKRKTNVSRQTHSSVTSPVRMQSGNSTYRRELGSASNRYGFGRDREHSGNSDRRSGNRNFMTARQSNTFAAYAKYNDIVNATKAREKASESPITSNKNDLSALAPEKTAVPPLDHLSSEKHMWISDWVASTSAALHLEDVVNDEAPVSKALSVIEEH